MIAKFAHASRWAERVKGAALLATLAIGIASGYAFAISPTVDGGRDFVSGVTLIPNVFEADQVYVVPAGHQYTITDVTISNITTTLAQVWISVSNSTGSCQPLAAYRTNTLVVPGESTLHLPLNTGISFAAGKTVCFVSNDIQTHWTVRGYLSSAT